MVLECVKETATILGERIFYTWLIVTFDENNWFIVTYNFTEANDRIFSFKINILFSSY